MSFKYFTPNTETLDAERSKDAREVANQAGVAQFFLMPGITHVRILPPFSERGVWYRELWEYNVVVDGQRRVFTAPSQTGQPDPFEERKQALLAMGGDNVKLAETLKINRRFLFNALVWVAPPGVEFKPGEVVVLKAPVTVKRALLEMDRDVQGGWADITNPQAGVNIKITRTGKGLQTTYQVAPMPNRTNLAADLQQCQVDVNSLTLFNLDELYQPLPYEELRRIANQVTAVATATQVAVPVRVAPPAPVVVPTVAPTTPTLPGGWVVNAAPAPGVAVDSAPVTATTGFVPGLTIPPPPPATK